MAEGAGPGGPAAAGHELAGVGAVGVEVLAALAQHLLRAARRRRGRRRTRPASANCACRCAQRPARRPSDGGGVEAVVGEAAGGLLGDQAGVLEQAEVARDAGLGEAEHGGELGDVEALPGQHPQQAEPDVFAEQPVERGGLIHIYKSI